MKKEGESYYKHFIPEIELSIERNTGSVPADGKFHIVKAGKLVESFRSRKLAEERFSQLVANSGFKPKVTNTEQGIRLSESDERYAISKAIFWAEGPKYRQKGGRGGQGQVFRAADNSQRMTAFILQ